MIKTYIKKPIPIEAIKYDGTNTEEIVQWSDGKVKEGRRYRPHLSTQLIINTLEGEMLAQIGDYILKGIKGEYYSCNGDIFDESYKEVE